MTDLAGVPLGELRQASGRRLRFPLNRVPTVSFTVETDNPRAADCMAQDLTLLKAYDDASGAKVLRFLGPIVSAEKVRSASGGSIACTAAGVAWRLGHRLIGKSAAGATFGTTPLALVDRGEIAGRIIDALNAGEAINVFADKGDTGIRRGAIAATTSDYVGPWRYRPADESISDMSAVLDGFDWEVSPVEPTADALGVQLGALNIAGAIGGLKKDVLWEFGTGRKNVDTWRDVGDSGPLCNRGVNLPPGYPDNATQQPIELSDAPSIAQRLLHEAVIPGDLIVDPLRSKLVQDHVRIRKIPRRVITFEPIAEDQPPAGQPRRVPRYGVDFVAGDIMPFRAVELVQLIDTVTGAVLAYQETKTVDAFFRAYAVELEIGDDEVAKPTLTFVQEAS